MFSENLDDFLDTTFGLATAATLQGGSTGGVSGFIDAEYVDTLGMAGINPAFVCKAAAVTETDIGKTLTISSTVYTIKNRQPIDDGAFVRLQLQS
jgi:hypothetical protein